MSDIILIMSEKDKTNEKAVEDLTNHLNEYKHYYKIYNRILAVRMVKLGETRTKAGEYVHVDRQTVGFWVKAYDNEGIDGLIPNYSNCGVKCRLTDEQLDELYEIITNPNSKYTIKQIRRLIKEKYGVKYTYKQVWVITREKFGLNYRKPHIQYREAPENKEEILKKI